MSIFRENEKLYHLLSDFCRNLTDTPRFQEAHRHINRFLENEIARTCYEQLLDLEDELHQKQHDGSIGEDDLAGYREINERLQHLPYAEEFFSAQNDLEDIHSQIMNFLGMVVEDGQIPSQEELDESCSCGCHDGEHSE